MNLAALAILLLAPPVFRGCGGSGDGGDPVPLPTVDAGAGCVLDSDCMADECVDVRCVGGTCLEIAPTRDGDLDGVAPAPCGMDCDDGNAAVFPGAAEQCDALDNDCDSVVDEDAPPGARRFDLGPPTADASSVVLSWRPGFVVTTARLRPPLGISGQPVLADGTIDASLAFPAVSTESEEPRTHAGASAPDGRLLIAAGTSGGRVHWSVLTPGSGGTASRTDGGSFAAPGPVARVAVAWHIDGWAVVVDSDAPFARNLTFLPAAAPVLVPVASGAAPTTLGIASDGTSIAVSEADAVSFFGDSGGRLARHPALGPLGQTPLASWDGDVIVTWADSFDWNLGHQRSSAARPSSVQAAPRLGTSVLGDVLGIARAGERVVITRGSSAGTAAFIARGTDFAPVRSFDESMISGGFRGTTADRVSVADSDGAIGILSTFGDSASLAVLACGI